MTLAGRRQVVVGHRMVRDGAQVALGYVLVPYPLGFVDARSLLVAPARLVDAVVAEGYESPAGAAHLAQLEALARESAGIPYEEYAQGVALLQGLAQEGGTHGGQA